MTAPLRVVSLFSGVGGFDLGLERAGMVTVAQVEWDKKCQSVLARHWPDVPRWGDVSEVKGAELPECDLVAFGSPCQDLSVAGKRAGMVEGETRSGLFYEAVRVIQEMQEHGRSAARTPVRWVLWENVVGALSSNGGADFGAVLDALGGLGAVDVQWRILDAQFAGVPQRRRRVFVVARLDPRAVGREQVLPLGARVRRNPAARGEARSGAPAGPEGGAPGGGRLVARDGELVGSLTQSLGAGGPDDGQAQAGWLVPEIANQLLARDAKGTPTRIDAGEGNLVPFVKAKRAANPDDDETSTGDGPAPTLNAFDNGGESRATVVAVEGEPVIAPTLTAYNLDSRSPQSEEQQRLVAAVCDATPDLAVRRLTPRECERLMGWPDDWTRWAADGSEVADSSRYRMCGNGVASPVAEWIGRCIVAAEQELDG